MPLINPDISFDPIEPEEDFEELDDDTIDEVLASEGLIDAKPKPNNDFQKVLNSSGASVADAAFAIANIMKNSKYDNARLKAAEIILDLQGVRDKEGKIEKAPTFNFIVNGGAVNLGAVFAPERRPGITHRPVENTNSEVFDQTAYEARIRPPENQDEMFKDIVKRVDHIEARRLLFEGKLIEPAYGDNDNLEEIINGQYFPGF